MARRVQSVRQAQRVQRAPRELTGAVPSILAGLIAPTMRSITTIRRTLRSKRITRRTRRTWIPRTGRRWPKALPEQQARRAIRARRVRPALPAQRVLPGRLAQREHRGQRALLDRRARKVLPARSEERRVGK